MTKERWMANAGKERVGIVGVGRMGLAMLKHLVKHGYPVTACDIDDKQLAKAREAGATAVKTPAEVARAADFVIIGVGYDDEINAVVLGAEGLLADLAPGSIIAVSSTAKPDTVKALDQRAQAQGVGVLDAPICRGRFAADEGTLLALVGASPTWSSAAAQSTAASARTTPILARSATARSARP
jgi:3-hydroxyisobutyrate dehydrogenase